RELAAGIAPLVASEGIVVLSGILCEQATSVDEAYAAVGLRPIAESVEGHWCARTYALAEA
ncbi:MAG TPA: 50S ribosomal protein L11 methyltransferase, partial [Acidimicrobiales bacterium]